MKLVEKHPSLFLSLLAILYAVPGIATLPLLDRDEPRFAQATIEMMDKGEWIIPYFNNEYRFDKPPLSYWWMRLNYSIFGKHEFSARLHSVFASWMTALIIFQIAKHSGFKIRKSLLSAIIWLSSFQVLIHSRVAVADMLLIACLTVSLWSLIQLLIKQTVETKPHSKWFYLLYISMALGFLAKGPLAILIPLISVFFSSFFLLKDPLLKKRLKQVTKESLSGLVLMTGIVALWGIPALILTEGAYFNIGVKEHVVQRGLESFNNRNYIPGVYYIMIVFIFFSPWVSKLIPALKLAWKEKFKNPFALILLSWVFSTFLIFAFYKTQLPHYILPAYPAMALLIGLYFESLPTNTFQLSIWFNRIAFIALISGLACVSWNLNTDTLLNLKLATLTLALFLLALLIASEFVKRNLKIASLLLVGIASLLFFPLSHNVRSTHITVKTSQVIKNTLPNASNFYASGFTEPSLVWYLNNYCTFLDETRVTETEIREGDCLILLSRKWRLDKALIQAWSSETVPPSYDQKNRIKAQFSQHTIRWLEGFNLGNGTWAEVAVITK